MIDQGKTRTLPPRQPYRTNIASPLQTSNRADANVTPMARASYPLPTSDKGHMLIITLKCTDSPFPFKSILQPFATLYK